MTINHSSINLQALWLVSYHSCIHANKEGLCFNRVLQTVFLCLHNYRAENIYACAMLTDEGAIDSSLWHVLNVLFRGILGHSKWWMMGYCHLYLRPWFIMQNITLSHAHHEDINMNAAVHLTPSHLSLPSYDIFNKHQADMSILKSG